MKKLLILLLLLPVIVTAQTKTYDKITYHYRYLPKVRQAQDTGVIIIGSNSIKIDSLTYIKKGNIFINKEDTASIRGYGILVEKKWTRWIYYFKK